MEVLKIRVKDSVKVRDYVPVFSVSCEVSLPDMQLVPSPFFHASILFVGGTKARAPSVDGAFVLAYMRPA